MVGGVVAGVASLCSRKRKVGDAGVIISSSDTSATAVVRLDNRESQVNTSKTRSKEESDNQVK